MDLRTSLDKIGRVLALLRQAQDKVDPDSVYGRRISLVADCIRPLQDLPRQLAVKAAEKRDRHRSS